ncbi:MAG: CocE/NonD family hydrolase [Rhodobacteraceae bacterium]|nr:CocE/NonD family hydrolase [Paracoccaceae bacterium]
MRIVTEFPRAVTDEPDMGIVLSDGCRLSARVWMPGDAMLNPVPAVLEFIPYRKRDGTLPRDELMHPFVAGHGFACLRVDMRGNGDSEGLMDDEYTAQELQDACEVIAWAAAQPWCTGRVGMMGKSWGGFNTLQTAFLRPPALKAAISVMSTTDRFADDIHFKGGCLLGENLGWGAVMLSYSSRPPDPALRPGWREEWLRRLHHEPFLAPRWAGHQARDGYWKHGSVCEDWEAIQVPVLSVGGWADGYMNTVPALVANLKVPVKGIVGPWVHQYPHTAHPGPRIGFLQEAIRWWDRWLKDIPNGAEADPAYRVWMQESAPPDACATHRPGHWVAEPRWPDSPRITRLVLALSPGGVLGGQGGRIGAAIRTPQHLGMQAGEFFPMGHDAEMPGDQREDDALSVCFDGAPLEAQLDLMGAAVLTATVSADRPLAFLVARLCDVAPDGASTRLAHGMLNLCHREDRERPSPMVPGEAARITLALDHMACRLAPGHRLRLALSTTYWPFLWPSPEAATGTLLEGALDLPVHAGSGNEWSPPEPATAAPWRHRVLREASGSRRIERDLIRGTHALVIESDTGEAENLDHGLVTGERMAERWEIRPDDPLSASADIRWEQRLMRGDWKVRTEAEARMTATATELRMTARLTAWEGETEVFRRSWDERVPRRFV